ncbi:CDP-glycerol glycerophosphotransferase family protein [Brevibacterium spongiae]|uniref:CDP-glycerol glycerophosphotransferase family protein n=1 Tax=Brevibacterium spongiae TaxID=2909672 RepID=A0ABY5SL67_9MICO|nr:CDP-glycerol glycerophosphotransferase family protein [Brevibacterium spongiae]UVI35273.1 CDP-glycerol glycerophosphotransferase family protein [Brevibacterium spongiae]
MADSESKSAPDGVSGNEPARAFLKGALTSFASYEVLALLSLFSVFIALSGSALLLFAVWVAAISAWDTFRLWKKRSRLGHRAVVRALLVIAVSTAFTAVDSDNGLLAAIAGVVVVGPIFFESLLAKGTNSKETFITGLPGIRTYGPLKGYDRPLLTVSEIAILVGAITVWLGTGPILWLISGLFLDALYFSLAAAAFVRIRKNAEAKASLHDALVSYQPEFYIYTSRPDDASYQVMMWLPYLARTGKKFAIITRNNVPAKALAELTDAPIITCPKSADLEKTLVPSLGAVYYVNASSRNGEMIRHQEYTHVYLGHGDSDKPPSYNPTHAMYNRIFAAGQAATERYGAHGVTISPEKFEIVGRPQLETVDVTTELPAGGSTTVLYAPTWRGHVDETMLHSLPVAPQMITELIKRGMTVVFRPHPFSYEFEEDAATIRQIQGILDEDRMQSGRQHVFGDAAEKDMDVIECMNLSDAMISDVSSVVSDYLYSGKPFAMTAVSAQGEDFIEQYPIARASYVLNGDLSNLDEVLNAILETDPRRQNRLQYRSFYLGDFPDEGYAENFVSAAARMVTESHNYAGEIDESDNIVEDDSAADNDGEGEKDEASSAENASEVTEPDADLVDSRTVRGTLSLIYRKLGGRTLIPAALASLTFILASADLPAVLACGSGLLAGLGFLFVHRRSFKSKSRLAGVLRASNSARAVVAAVLASFWAGEYGLNWVVNSAVAVLVITIVMESSLAKSWKVTGLEARNLPNAETRGFQPVSRGTVAVANAVVISLGWLFAAFGTFEYLLLALSVVPTVLATILFVAGLKRGLRSIRLDWQLYDLLDEYGAEFVVYFGSNVGITYQLGMWLPYLDRIGKKFIVVTRSLKMMRAAGQITEAPVINRPTLRSLEEVITPSVGAAFYVNNAGKNTHFIERREIKHVWLNHGDSEKPACFNPVHAIYDVIFAAGQAGIDRYERHGVRIPLEKFKIVGRPQVDQIKFGGSEPTVQGAGKTVLYAPTWKGAYQDSELYSLPSGAEIVRELLARDCTVVFRAHPLNYRYANAREYIAEIHEILEADAKASGRQHVWGPAAEKEMTTDECFNASDAMISDVSAVVTDFLQSGKPLSVVSVARTREELLNEVPAAKAAYILEEDLSNLSEVLDGLLVDDVKASERDSMRKYYLGDFAPETYADTFLATSRQMIAAGQQRNQCEVGFTSDQGGEDD